MSRKLAALGYASFGESNIVEKSMDILRMMRDKIGETAMLGTLLEDACVLIEQAPGRHPFKFLGEVGMRISFNASAPGKAMLAFLRMAAHSAFFHFTDPFFQPLAVFLLTMRDASLFEMEGFFMDQAA